MDNDVIDNLGDFYRVYEYDGELGDAEFLVRGLTTAEYGDLSVKDKLKESEELYWICFQNCVMEWDGIEHTPDGADTPEPMPCTPENKQKIPGPIQQDVGKFALETMTMIDEQEAEKFRGFVRFFYWQSDEDSRDDKYECESCLDSGRAVRRPCGKYSMETRKKASQNHHVDDEPDESDASESMDSVMDRYRSGPKKNPDRRVKTEDEQKRKDVIVEGGFEFPECPISWIDPMVHVLGEMFYHVEKSDMTFFSGGMADQPYKLYRASKIVQGEFNAIENEKMEEETNS